MMKNCKLLNEIDSRIGSMLTLGTIMAGVSLCDSCSYDICECLHSKTVTVGLSGYKILNREEKLPKQRAWCKQCLDNSAKPIHFVSFNGKLGIVVECTKCHDRYVMYESLYNERYVGRHTKYGYIPPTYGQSFGRSSVPRNVRDRMDKSSDRLSQQRDKELSNLFGYTMEEYENKRKVWEEERVKEHKKFQQKEDERRTEYMMSMQQKKNEERKQLIANGTLRYDKKLKCLVNTETNQPVKI